MPVLLMACGTTRPEGGSRVESPATAERVIQASEPTLGDGVEALAPTCAPESAERCDALDSDCDGVIDEDCPGAVEGLLAAAIAWNSVADLDLMLEGPSDARAENRTRSRGGCVDPVETRIERLALPDAQPGEYRLLVQSADACGGDGASTVTLSVSVGSEVLGTYNRAVAADERVEIIRFVVE